MLARFESGASITTLLVWLWGAVGMGQEGFSVHAKRRIHAALGLGHPWPQTVLKTPPAPFLLCSRYEAHLKGLNRSTVRAERIRQGFARPSEGRTPEAEPRMDAFFGVSGKALTESFGGFLQINPL